MTFVIALSLQTHQRKQSKLVPRFTKSKHESSSSKLDRLSEEAFCHKASESGGKDSAVDRGNAWSKPLGGQVPTTSAVGLSVHRSEASVIRNRNSRGAIKPGSFEHQDSGVDISSDQPQSTTSSQRSSPGDQAKRAALITSARSTTQATSITLSKAATEGVS